MGLQNRCSYDNKSIGVLGHDALLALMILPKDYVKFHSMLSDKVLSAPLTKKVLSKNLLSHYKVLSICTLCKKLVFDTLKTGDKKRCLYCKLQCYCPALFITQIHWRNTSQMMLLVKHWCQTYQNFVQEVRLDSSAKSIGKSRKERLKVQGSNKERLRNKTMLWGWKVASCVWHT